MRQVDLWISFFSHLGAKGEPGQVFADLDGRYREPGRFYHTWEHVIDCLGKLDATRSLCDSPLAVELALWFHDAVCNPRADDNEARSAQLALDMAAAMGIDHAFADLSARLILSTAHGSRSSWEDDGDRDAALVQDIDLAILGSAPRIFSA